MSIPVKPKKKSDSAQVELLQFASAKADADITEITSGHRTDGWDSLEKPSGLEWDYWRKRTYQWLQRLTTTSFFNDGDLVRVSDEDAPHLKGFVVGSKQLDRDAGDGTHDSDIRIFLRKAKGAFRAGWFTGTQADDANTGSGSVAIGKNPTASGDDSAAIGPGTVASGQGATAIGANVGTDSTTTASGDYSVAIGRASEAASADSCALMGGKTTADSALSCGQGTQAQGPGARATGLCGDAVTRLIIANGQGSDAHGYVENGGSIVATGNGSRAGGQALSALQSIQAVGVCSEAFGPGAYAGGAYSRATGYYPKSGQTGEVVHAGNTQLDNTFVPVPGSSQNGTIHAVSSGANAIPVPVGGSHTWTPPDNHAYIAEILVIAANRSTLGERITWKFSVRVTKVSGTIYLGTKEAAQPMTNKFISYNEAGAGAVGFSVVETGGVDTTPFSNDGGSIATMHLVAGSGALDVVPVGDLTTGGLAWSARIDYTCVGTV